MNTRTAHGSLLPTRLPHPGMKGFYGFEQTTAGNFRKYGHRMESIAGKQTAPTENRGICRVAPSISRADPRQPYFTNSSKYRP